MSKPSKNATAPAPTASNSAAAPTIPSLAQLRERIATMEAQRDAAQVRIAEQRAKHREAVAESILSGQTRPASPGLDAEEAELRRLEGDMSVLRDYIPRAQRNEAEATIAAALAAYAADAEAHRREVESQMIANFIPVIHAGYGNGDPAATAQAIAREIENGQRRAAVRSPDRLYRESVIMGISTTLRLLEEESRSNEAEWRSKRAATDRVDAVERAFTKTDPDALLKRAEAIYATIKAALVVT